MLLLHCTGKTKSVEETPKSKVQEFVRVNFDATMYWNTWRDSNKELIQTFVGSMMKE